MSIELHPRPRPWPTGSPSSSRPTASSSAPATRGDSSRPSTFGGSSTKREVGWNKVRGDLSGWQMNLVHLILGCPLILLD